MTTARLKKKNRLGSYKCCQCSEPIVNRQQYYEWVFKYGGCFRQHASHGAPRPSQLTQSRMASAHLAIETALDMLDRSTCPGDVADLLAACCGDIEQIRDEYRIGLDNMISQEGAVAAQSQARIEDLETYIQDLEDAGNEAAAAAWEDYIHQEGAELTKEQQVAKLQQDEELAALQETARTALENSRF